MVSRVVIGLAFIAMSAFNVYVLRECGLGSFFPPFVSLTATQLFVDLCMSASVAVWLIARERKRDGRAMWPVMIVVVGVALLGSPALLLYLLFDAMVGGRRGA
jgi:hypothetical protein